MADSALAGATRWRRLGRGDELPRPPITPERALQRDLRRALLAFGAAGVLIAAWHPWTVLTASPGASSTCGMVVSEAAVALDVIATGPGATEWCGGEIGRAPAGVATAEAVRIPTPSCDFYIGSVHVIVDTAGVTNAQSFCNSLGAIPRSS